MRALVSLALVSAMVVEVSVLSASSSVAGELDPSPRPLSCPNGKTRAQLVQEFDAAWPDSLARSATGFG